MLRQRLWLRHVRRMDALCCPLCYEPVRWVSDGIYYYPCNVEPVLFKRENGGKLSVIKRRELVEGCLLFKAGGAGKYERGLLPHVYSCEALKNHRLSGEKL